MLVLPGVKLGADSFHAEAESARAARWCSYLEVERLVIAARTALGGEAWISPER